jgi:hypothetical protein
MVPVMFKPGRDGKYTLTCNFDNRKFKLVLLEDRKIHTFQDMKAEPIFHFSATKTDDVHRFVLHFGSVNNNMGKDLPVTVYTSGSSLIINLTQISEETELLVFDVLGRKLIEQKLQGKIQHTIKFKVDTKVLMVTLKNPNGTFSRKLVW